MTFDKSVCMHTALFQPMNHPIPGLSQRGTANNRVQAATLRMWNKGPACREGRPLLPEIHVSTWWHPTCSPKCLLEGPKFVGTESPQPCQHAIGQESLSAWLPCPSLFLSSPVFLSSPLPLPQCPAADHRGCQPGTSKTPEGHTSLLRVGL